MKPEVLQDVLRDPRIWRGVQPASLSGQRTGFAALDRLLPQRGWPAAGLLELLPQVPGCGELGVLLPALRGQRQCWVNPPWQPYAPALRRAGLSLKDLLLIHGVSEEDGLWALEQVLRSGLYSHVLGWSQASDMRCLRRLQLAAEHGRCRLFLFRPAVARRQASPALLRLSLEPAENGLSLRILKCRGGQPGTILISDALVVSAPFATAAASPANRVA